MARDRNPEPRPVASLLESVLERIDPERRIVLWQKWAAVAGEPIASHARPQRLADGVLVVEVDSHTWAQELHFLRTDLQARLNRALGGDMVREIQIVSAAAPSAPAAARPGGRTSRRSR